MKKLKIFTNHYYPENFKLNELSKEFSEYYNVEVISQTPNYSRGSFFEGYSWFKRREELVGKIKVRRLPVIPRKEGHIMLMLNYLSYIISSFFYSVFTKEKSDHVFVYITSPIFISWAGLRFAKRNNIKSTLYLLDLWPGSLITIMGIKNEKIINILEKMCIKIYKRFDNIVVSSYRFIEVLADYGVNTEKIHYIPQHAENGIDRKLEIDSQKDVLKIVFTGNIGEAQGLHVLVETAQHLKNKNYHHVHFMIVGDGRYRATMESEIEKHDVGSYFTFTGFVDPSMIPGILASNHFGFVSLSDHDIFNRTLPAKVQSYMAYGIPIIASANGEVPWVIEEAKCGYSVPAEESKALSELLIDLNDLESSQLEILSQNSYNYSCNHFNLKKIVEQFIQIMKEGTKNV